VPNKVTHIVYILNVTKVCHLLAKDKEEYRRGYVEVMRCIEVVGYIYNIHSTSSTENRFFQPTPIPFFVNVIRLFRFCFVSVRVVATI